MDFPSQFTPGAQQDSTSAKFGLREGIDTAIPTGRAVAAIMATLAELELELGRERRVSPDEPANYRLQSRPS